jgi:serine/threonine protein kinase
MQELQLRRKRLATSTLTKQGNTGALPDLDPNSEHQVALARNVDHLRSNVKRAAVQLAQEEADRVVIRKVLGAGASGKVYAGVWRGMDVALKTVIVPGGSGAGLHTLERVIQEAAICTSLSHPNIVATYHFDIKQMTARDDEQQQQRLAVQHGAGSGTGTDYKLFLVQELCYMSLEQAIDKRVFDNPVASAQQYSEVLWILADVAAGLRFLHAKGVVHADLKPANILLKLEQNSQHAVTAKLADFGVSAVVDPGATHVSNFSRGTPFWIAPEVAFSHKASHASDVYSFGVMAWSLYTGREPFVALPDGGFATNALFFQAPAGADMAFTRLAYG